MLHPVFRLAASQPQLLAEHAAGYAGLLAEELASSAARLQRRVTFQVIGLLAFVVAAILGGVAVLLWAALPEVSTERPWLLWFTPLVPALLGALALWLAHDASVQPTFTTLREQLAQDAALLRSTTAP
jgi:hypothetical protein